MRNLVPEKDKMDEEARLRKEKMNQLKMRFENEVFREDLVTKFSNYCFGDCLHSKTKCPQSLAQITTQLVTAAAL